MIAKLSSLTNSLGETNVVRARVAASFMLASRKSVRLFLAPKGRPMAYKYPKASRFQKA
jgi:hypothetical protein